MPIYEYQCQKCSVVTEKMQKFSDEPLKTCPQCGGEVEKLLSLTSFSLKGSGWYVTDYKKSNGGSSAPPSKAISTPAVESSSATQKSEAPSASSTPVASASEKSKAESSTSN